MGLGERPPRLVLRFALLTALCLGAGAAAILLFTRHLHTVQAEKAAAQHAELVVETVLADKLGAADFAAPVGAERRSELDRLTRGKVLGSGAVLVTLSRFDRLVTYSTDSAMIGRRLASEARTKEVLSGTLTSDVTSIRDAQTQGERLKVLRSYVPLKRGGRVGIVGLYKDYGPIESAAREAFLPVAGILELVLVVLYILLIPLLARVSRRLRNYVERIRYQALHDDLTDLPNRLHFRTSISQSIEAARRDRSRVAVLLLDLDRFKEINDTLGHQSGDELLKELATRLRALTTVTVMLARLGGDEFGIVAHGAGASVALDLAEHVRAAIEPPFLIQGIPLVIEASIGISIYPEHGDDVDALVQKADVAMYGAKDRRLGIAVYDGNLDTNTADHLALVSELRRALDGEEIVLYFQPQADVRTGTVVGAEALIRWQHPVRGLMPPNDFVPYVERTGMSTALSAYVLTGAARQLREWRDQGVDLSLAVNLTMHDLLDTSLPDRVAEMLERFDVDPARLELEITERVIMADPVRVKDVVERLKRIGVRLAIDDFGTGYSSLSYLKSLPLDVIKIDRSFVMGMDRASDQAIVRSTIDLGHNLGLTVVAEGVEDQETLDELSRYGCDLVQGYLIARPAATLDLSLVRVSEPQEPAVSVG
jgi:diguanylate cyclase (GGDEF)-like protein